jgi:hypothetical protein
VKNKFLQWKYGKWKYAFYFINISLYFISKYILNNITLISNSIIVIVYTFCHLWCSLTSLLDRMLEKVVHYRRQSSCYLHICPHVTKIKERYKVCFFVPYRQSREVTKIWLTCQNMFCFVIIDASLHISKQCLLEHLITFI